MRKRDTQIEDTHLQPFLNGSPAFRNSVFNVLGKLRFCLAFSEWQDMQGC